MIRVILAFLVLAIIAGWGFAWATLHWSYSSGERAGYVQKLSRKGWLCKTWEGEMAMVTMPGTVAEKFYFTVPSDAVAQRLNADVGKRMALHFEQHKWIPSSCFGDTEYFVSDFRVTECHARLAHRSILGESRGRDGLSGAGAPQVTAVPVRLHRWRLLR